MYDFRIFTEPTTPWRRRRRLGQVELPSTQVKIVPLSPRAQRWTSEYVGIEIEQMYRWPNSGSLNVLVRELREAGFKLDTSDLEGAA